MKSKLSLWLGFFLISSAHAQPYSCRSHTYGDSVYDITVDPEKGMALLTGSDVWYHQDFLNQSLKILSWMETVDGVDFQAKGLSMQIRPRSKQNFGSPARYGEMKLDFDCRP